LYGQQIERSREIPKETYEKEIRLEEIKVRWKKQALESCIPNCGNAPSSPTNIVVTIGNGEASVSFGPPLSDGGSPITSYTITATPIIPGAKGDETNKTFKLKSSCTPQTANTIQITVQTICQFLNSCGTFIIPGMCNGVNYKIAVAANNAAGSSAPPTTPPTVTPTNTVPGSPVITGVTAGNTSAVVSFNAPTITGSSPIIGYIVVSNPGNIAITAENSPITVNGLTNGTAYNFSVYAVNSQGRSAGSTSSQTVTPTGPGLTGCQVYGPNGTILTFKCHNLGADETADPYTPSWKLNGHYYQWGRSQIAANAPVNNSIDGANQGTISGWNNTNAPDDSWKDTEKTVNDPCPSGWRVPTKAEWDAVSNININPVREFIGSSEISPTNYSSGIRVGSGNTGLFLPAGGIRAAGDSNNGSLLNRGITGRYWSSSQSYSVGNTGINNPTAWHIRLNNTVFDAQNFASRANGFSIRCIKENN
jgi:uncharacterized protein (TIGR02145 family)